MKAMDSESFAKDQMNRKEKVKRIGSPVFLVVFETRKSHLQ